MGFNSPTLHFIWQCTLIGKRLAWKASVTGNRDGGSSPLTVADVVAKWNEGIWLQPRERGFDSLRHLSMLWSLSGGASAPKADSQQWYVGSNPIHSVLGFGVKVSRLTLNQQMGVRFSQSQLYVRVAHLEERPAPNGKAVGSNPITNTVSP